MTFTTLKPHHPHNVDRILAVDDSPDNLFLIQTILSEENYEIELAEDGRTALERIDRDPPDLVLLDVMMPGMDGFEVTQRIRNNPKLPFIPIVLITAHDRPSVVKGLDSGADDFIRKPVDVDELLARVRSLLSLKHSVDAMEELSRQRQDFVSRLTHDLRTPLVAADRMLALFEQGAFGQLASEGLEAVDTMRRSNRNLLQMVNTMLEVYRHEAGYKEMTFSPFDLCEAIAEVTQELFPLAASKHLELEFHPDSSVKDGCKMVGDRLEIHRVLSNAVGNAIKFTEQGRVEVKLRIEEGDASRAIVEVCDTGIGVAEELCDRIFDRFRTGNYRESGSGLGLYLSRTIIEAHQGSISMKSRVGEGSHLTIVLPLMT